jgi:adenine-specific DNA-methyltransferase
MLPDGTYRGLSKTELEGRAALPQGARLYTPGDLQSQNSASVDQAFDYRGKTYRPGQNSHWKANFPDGMDRLAWANRIHVAKNSIRYVRYADDFGYKPATNMWTDTGTGNFTDDKIYVVQTNTKVVERCVLMSTDPGDLVLDPTCGSGTTALMAEKSGRRWITIDTSRVSLALARQRIMGGQFPYYVLADPNYLRKGFVYGRAPHIKIESIANNTHIKPGMTQEEIDKAILADAEVELIYDEPEEKSGTVRVSGPFTVESLSPHATVAPVSSASEDTGTEDDGSAFEKSIVDNLLKAGVQNGRKAERLLFDSLTPYAGEYIQAEGIQRDTEQRVAVSIGPRYGTVDPEFIRKAAREATRGLGFDLLLVCAFSFDPQAGNAMEEFSIGRVRVLLVRMNSDLAMGDVLLKKTGSGNLFTVFGEPDVAVTPKGDDVVVEIKGVDVYNPTTGEIRSSGTGEIALWMIDTDYDGESFFVRHCYFTGNNDPYKRLKTALKADIDPVAWETLYQTRSRPFPKPESGKIAVKVINHYGDEVLQVYEV